MSPTEFAEEEAMNEMGLPYATAHASSLLSSIVSMGEGMFVVTATGRVPGTVYHGYYSDREVAVNLSGKLNRSRKHGRIYSNVISSAGIIETP